MGLAVDGCNFHAFHETKTAGFSAKSQQIFTGQTAVEMQNQVDLSSIPSDPTRSQIIELFVPREFP